MSILLQESKRWFATGMCAALVVAIACMAVAVLIQALAVLIIALLAASVLLPHPLKWYAKEGAESLRFFVLELFSFEKKTDDTETDHTSHSNATQQV